MPHQAIISALSGPGRAMVATPIINLTDLHINFADRRVHLDYDAAPNFASDFELSNTANIVITNNNGNFTVTIT